MRILLDECLPKDLARELPGPIVKTVPQAGWASASNGRLLRLIADSGRFDLFVTMDKRLPDQKQEQGPPFRHCRVARKVEPVDSCETLRAGNHSANG